MDGVEACGEGFSCSSTIVMASSLFVVYPCFLTFFLKIRRSLSWSLLFLAPVGAIVFWSQSMPMSSFQYCGRASQVYPANTPLSVSNVCDSMERSPDSLYRAMSGRTQVRKGVLVQFGKEPFLQSNYRHHSLETSKKQNE